MTPDDWEPLEAMLRELPLRQPPETLDRRLAGLRAPRPRRPRRLVVGAALGAILALAAGLLVMIRVLEHQVPEPIVPAPQPAPLARVEPGPPPVRPPEIAPAAEPPVRIEQVWCTPLGKQVVMQNGDPPVLEERCQVTRRLCLIDEQQQVTTEWTVSGEQSRVVPLECN